MTHLIILTGAAGAGKTTAVNFIKTQNPSLGHVHPDSLWDTFTIDSKNILEMATQLAITQAENKVLIDCQIRPVDVQETIGHLPVTWSLILIDCPDSVREERLKARGWTEEKYDFNKIADWSKTLKKDANEMECLTLDSSEKSVEEVYSNIINLIGA